MRPLTPEQADLAARHVPLARGLASTWGRRGPHWRYRRAEIVGAAMVALCLAVRDYRTPSPIAFATFARWRACRSFAGVPREDPPPPAGFAEPASPCPRLAEVDALDAAEAILRRLPARNADALRLTVLDGLTQAEAARRIGCRQTEVSRLIRQSRTLLGA